MTEKNNREAIFKTGLRKEDLETRAEGRDFLQEFIEDYELMDYSIESLLQDLAGALEAMEVKKASPDIITQAELVQEGLKSFQNKLRKIGEQGELFAGMTDEAGQEVSVKQRQLENIKKEFRDWYNLVGGLKNLKQKITHDFGTVEELGSSIFAASEKGRKQTYGRSFSESVSAWEKAFAEEMDMADAAVCNSGMSAVETCLRAGDLKPGEAILVGKDFYVVTHFLLKELEQRGIKVIQVNVTDLQDVQNKIKENKPKFVLFEGIANAPSMETADIEGLLKQNEAWNKENPETPCRLIVDNTFASPALLNLDERVKKLNLTESKWAVVESATKYYQGGMDNITAGLVYSNDAEFIKAVKMKRRLVGTHLQERLISYLPQTDAALLEHKMLRHSLNALLLASHLENLGLKVYYPGLESYPQRALATATYSKGLGGVFYLTWKNEDGSPQEFVNQVAQEAKKLGLEVKIGVSFGHPETWLETLPPNAGANWQKGDTRQWTVRVMPGEENIAQMKKVLEAFKNAYQSE